MLDQILVSEEFVASSRFAQGDVKRVDYFNDHLHEGRDGSRSGHGFVRALLRLYERDGGWVLVGGRDFLEEIGPLRPVYGREKL